MNNQQASGLDVHCCRLRPERFKESGKSENHPENPRRLRVGGGVAVDNIQDYRVTRLSEVHISAHTNYTH